MTPDPATRPREFLEHLFAVAVARALPLHNTARFLPAVPRGRTIVLGAGKAGGSMAQAVEALWPADAPLEGLVVTRYGHTPPRPAGLRQRIEIVEASHPVPDAAGLAAAQRILTMAHGLTPDDLVLCLISGGGSALLTLPADGLTLEDKQDINQQLLNSGANIGEMNCVRKHLSRIKGGRLAAACGPARVVSLMISDVPGDDPSTIASGPTVADATTCTDALSILKRYDIAVPGPVAELLASGALETPKPGDAIFAGHAVRLIATPQQSLEAAAALARRAGIEAHILGDEIEGESRDVAQVLAAIARQVAHREQPFRPPCVLLSGGETTVTVTGRGGRGGRASEFLLACAIALRGEPRIWALAADTDGIDGIESNAGARIGPDSLARAAALDLSAREFLDRHDAYAWFEPLGDLVVTGPTFTNVNDFRALLVL